MENIRTVCLKKKKNNWSESVSEHCVIHSSTHAICPVWLTKEGLDLPHVFYWHYKRKWCGKNVCKLLHLTYSTSIIRLQTFEWSRVKTALILFIFLVKSSLSFVTFKGSKLFPSAFFKFLPYSSVWHWIFCQFHIFVLPIIFSVSTLLLGNCRQLSWIQWYL